MTVRSFASATKYDDSTEEEEQPKKSKTFFPGIEIWETAELRNYKVIIIYVHFFLVSSSVAKRERNDNILFRCAKPLTKLAWSKKAISRLIARSVVDKSREV